MREAEGKTKLFHNKRSAEAVVCPGSSCLVSQKKDRTAVLGCQTKVSLQCGLLRVGAYVVAKSAMVALIKVLALEVGDSVVTANGVLPTTIDTPANRTSMPTADFNRWLKPESIAHLLVFLASEGAGAINGALIPIGSP